MDLKTAFKIRNHYLQKWFILSSAIYNYCTISSICLFYLYCQDEIITIITNYNHIRFISILRTSIIHNISKSNHSQPFNGISSSFSLRLQNLFPYKFISNSQIKIFSRYNYTMFLLWRTARAVLLD